MLLIKILEVNILAQRARLWVTPGRDVLLLNGLNPKFEYRNPKQILNSNAQMLKTIKKIFIS
jgi:hypothetical protein